MARKRIRILVTAFGAFPGAPSNPTLRIAEGLGRARGRLDRLGVELVTATLPVTYKGLRKRLKRALDEQRPDIVLHLGLAGRRKSISVETRGGNRRSTLRHDSARRTPKRPTIDAGGEALRMVQLPVAAMARAIGRAGAPARLSIDAGDYVCNQTLYTSLGLGANAGFIHVPRSRALRRPLRADRLDPRPTIDAMTAGVLAAIVICAAQTRNAALARALRGRA